VLGKEDRNKIIAMNRYLAGRNIYANEKLFLS
jgi:hypothetical protein